jgi:hypothetical protein
MAGHARGSLETRVGRGSRKSAVSRPFSDENVPFGQPSEQASHNGDLVHGVEAGVVKREEVTRLGDVLAGTAEGRRSNEEVTVFDSTGLAIQDLAIALFQSVEHAHIRSASASVVGSAFHPLERNTLPLAQRFVPLHLKRGEVAEIDVSVVAGNPAVAFFIFPPAHRAGYEIGRLS